MRLLLTLRQQFCKAIPSPNLLSFYDVISPSSLSQAELKHLHTLESYQHSIKSFNSNRIQDSINYISRTSSLIQQSNPSQINTRSYLLNIKSILYKMENEDTNLCSTLKQQFLLNTSYYGFNSNSYKHFQNYFLSLLYTKKQLASGLINYINYQDLPPEFQNRIKLLESILYSLNEKTQNESLTKIQQFTPQNKEDEVIAKNNSAWYKLWNKNFEKDDMEKKQQFHTKLAQQIIIALKTAQLQDTSNYIKERSSSEQLALKYLLENPHKNQTLSKGKSFDVLKFIHKHSHIISMNLGEMLFLARKEQEANLWLQLSTKSAVDYQQFIRVTRGLILTARMFLSNGMPQESQSIYLGALKHHYQLPQHSLQSLLLNYSGFLQKTHRYYEAQEYLNQVVKMGDFEQADRLDRLLVPDYNFML